MGWVSVSISEDDNVIGKTEEVSEKVKSFEEKWPSIMDLFEGEFFVTVDGDVALIVCCGTKSFSFTTNEFSTVDDGKPSKSRAVARFLACSNEREGDTGFEIGQKALPMEFYEDLCSHFDIEVFSFYATVEIQEGYFNGHFYIEEEGVSWDFTFYEFDEDI